MLTKTTSYRTKKTSSFWGNTLSTIGNFIEKHPKISLGLFVLTIAGTGSLYGYLFGPAGWLLGTTVGTVAAAKQVNGKAKTCPEYWQDPTNNCAPIDFAQGIQSIEHYPDGGGKVKSVYPMDEDACKQFDKDVKLAALLDPAQDTTSHCRSAGPQECSCEAHYTAKPRFVAS
jgi:hypothetical protein